MTGKNHVERSFRLYFDDAGTTARNLTVSLVPGSVSGGGYVFDEADMTGVSETTYNFLKDRGSCEISARFHMDDTADTGSTTVINGHNAGAGTGTLTLQWGASGAAPASTNPEWEGEYVLINGGITLDGNKFVHNVTFKPTGSTAPAWTTVS